MNVDHEYEIIQEVCPGLVDLPQSAQCYRVCCLKGGPLPEYRWQWAVMLWASGLDVEGRKGSKIETKSTLPPCRPAGHGEADLSIARPGTIRGGARLKPSRRRVVFWRILYSKADS